MDRHPPQLNSRYIRSSVQEIQAPAGKVVSCPELPGAAIPEPVRRPLHPIRRVLVVFCALIATYVLIVWLDGLLTKLPPLASIPNPGERVGIVHVHTKASDGSGSFAQVIDSAEKADISFLAITDHNIAMSRAAVAAAQRPNLVIIAGEEVSTTSGHYLALGITDAWPRGETYDARSLMASTRRTGAANFIAHPFGLEKKWSDWSIADYDGMEIFNDDAIWRKNTVFDLVTALIMYPVNRRLALVRLARTPHENLAKWDELQQSRPVAGICGADAHAAIRISGHVIAKFPWYLSVFSLIREHVLLAKESSNAPNRSPADAIIAALKSGKSFCSADAIYPADGFTQTVTPTLASSRNGASNSSMPATSGTLITAGPGTSLPFVPGATLHVATPAGSPHALLRVLRDGREIARQESTSLDLVLPGPGRYRSEAYLRQPGLTGWRRWTLWVVPNPITLTAPEHSR